MPPDASRSSRYTVLRAYDRTVDGLALISVALLAAIPIVIVYDAVLRVLRVGASVWAIDFTAIALVYITFLGSPWLLRKRGHVYVALVLNFLDPAARALVGKIVCSVCAAICLVLAYRAVEVVVANIGEYDVSAIDTPRWIRFAPLPVGFVFLAAEFLRILFGSDALHTAERSPDI